MTSCRLDPPTHRSPSLAKGVSLQSLLLWQLPLLDNQMANEPHPQLLSLLTNSCLSMVHLHWKRFSCQAIFLGTFYNSCCLSSERSCFEKAQTVSTTGSLQNTIRREELFNEYFSNSCKVSLSPDWDHSCVYMVLNWMKMKMEGIEMFLLGQKPALMSSDAQALGLSKPAVNLISVTPGYEG